MTPEELEASYSRNEAVQAVKDMARAMWEQEETLMRYERAVKDFKQRCERLECENAILVGENEELKRQTQRQCRISATKQTIAADGEMIIRYKGVKAISTIGRPGGDHDQLVDDTFRNVEYTIHGPKEVTIEF
jgi:regulator of replication initiation timing